METKCFLDCILKVTFHIIISGFETTVFTSSPESNLADLRVAMVTSGIAWNFVFVLSSSDNALIHEQSEMETSITECIENNVVQNKLKKKHEHILKFSSSH